MAVTANSQHPDLAVQLLDHLTSEESQKEAALVGGVPTRRAVLQDDELAASSLFPILMEGMEQGVVRPRHAKWSAAEEVLGAELSAAVVEARR